MMQADMHRGVGAHGMADHVRLLDAERIHECDDIGARHVLAVTRRIVRHVGRRIAALAIGDAAMGAREIAHLRLPLPIVASEFVHEDDGRAGADLFVIELRAVRGFDLWHD